MKRKNAIVAAALIGIAGVAIGAPRTIVLPPDGMQLKPSPLPGYAKAQASCVACHSAEYMQYQPPTAPRPYWDAMVKRMRKEFAARSPAKAIPRILANLPKTSANSH